MLLVIAGAVVGVLAVRKLTQRPGDGDVVKAALDRRLAEGRITAAQYEEARRALAG
jgi:hypothetical protein